MEKTCTHPAWSARRDGKTLRCVACGIPDADSHKGKGGGHLPTIEELRHLIGNWNYEASKASDGFQQAATEAAVQPFDAGPTLGSSKKYQAGEHLGHATGLRRAVADLRALLGEEGAGEPRS